ncbi:MAG: glycosyltransferase family 4 protein [Myxococcota bacterium]
MSTSIPGKLHFVVPGPLTTLTGGFIYDRRIIDALEGLGWALHVIEWASPAPTQPELDALVALPENDSILIDGLSLHHLADALPEVRARCIGLIHHPCSLEPYQPEKQAVRDAEKRALAALSGILSTSHHTASQLEPLGVSPPSVHVIHPATDVAPLITAPRNPRPRLLTVATLTHRKGHDILLDAVAELDFEWELEWVGSERFEPEWARQLRERAQNLPVEIHGELRRDALERTYERADLFVFPSRYEGFGMAPLEAIRRGLPTLSSRAGALEEALPADAAHFVDPDPESLRRGLEHCLDPVVLASLRAGAHAQAKNLPTWSDAGARFSEALRALGVAR